MKKTFLKFALCVAAILVLLPTGKSLTKNYATTVVHKVSLTSQTTVPTSIITIYSPSADETSDFRVSVYISAPTQSPGGSAGVAIYWTDENGAANQGCSSNFSVGIAGSQYGAVQNSGTCVLHTGSGQSISYQVTGSGTITYDLFITVEEL